MVSREEYISHYIKHYEQNGKSGAGVGLGDKPEILRSAGYNDEMSLLDYGCGWGAILQGIDPVDYLGVDIVPQAIQIARKEFPGRSFEVLEIGKLKTTPKDFAVAFSVFTHARHEDSTDCLSDIYNNLKDGGRGLVDILEGDDSEDIHFRFWNMDDFCSLLKKIGFGYESMFKRKAVSGFTHTYIKINK